MPTETYIGDEIYIMMRRFRNDSLALQWTLEGAFSTYDENDAKFADYPVAEYLGFDPEDQEGLDDFGGEVADAMGTELGVDPEKESAPGTPGTPPLTLTEDYLADEVYVTIKRYRDPDDDDLHWTTFGSAQTMDDETDQAVALRYVDDLFNLLDGSDQEALEGWGELVATTLAAARGGVATEKPE